MLYDDALSSSPTCKTTARLHTTHQYLLDTKIYLETSPWEITSSNHLVPSSKYVDICMFHMMLAHMIHIDPSISDIAAMCSARPVPGIFCSQKHTQYVYRIQVLQPYGSSPTRILEGLVSSEQFFYSQYITRQASLANNDQSIPCTYSKAASSRSGFPIILLAWEPIYKWVPVNLHILALRLLVDFHILWIRN